MTTTPPNLRDLFGDRFRIGYDPAAATRVARMDPWMQTMPCQNGVIYPYGVNRLAVECKTATARRLTGLPNIIVHQQGDTDWTLLFDLAMFEAVAKIVKPRKRRRLSKEQKAANVEKLKVFQFKNGTQHTAQKRPKDASGPSKVAG